MARQLDERQQRFLSDLEKREKTVNLIFKDHQIPTDTFAKWLRSKTFTRAIEDLNVRMEFRLEQELVYGAAVAAERLHQAAMGACDLKNSAEVQALINTIRLSKTIVRDPKLKRDAAEERERSAQRRFEQGLSRGYHRSHSPEQAAALLRRIAKRRRREERLDRDQDEDGRWMPAD
jgi:hypothetical protein